MFKFYRLAAAAFLIALMTPGVIQAADASIEVNVNDSDFEARLDVLVNPLETPLSVGAGFLYSDDDNFWLTNLNISIKDEVFTPGLNLGLGFKGVFGESDILLDDLTTLAVPFQFLFEFDFRESGANLPISITANLAWAPEIRELLRLPVEILSHCATWTGKRGKRVSRDSPKPKDTKTSVGCSTMRRASRP